MHTIYVFLAVLAIATRAHMSLWYPPPLGGSLQANPLTTEVDNELNFPIGCCDSDGRPTLPSPGDCRGHLDLPDTEEGRPQVHGNQARTHTSSCLITRTLLMLQDRRTMAEAVRSASLWTEARPGKSQLRTMGTAPTGRRMIPRSSTLRFLSTCQADQLSLLGSS
jgi:hypothetical protein